MVRSVKLAVTLVLITVLPGCGYLFGDQGVFRDKSEDYKKAPEMPVINVPDGKDTDALQEIYPIPEIQDSVVLAGEFEVPRPTPLVAGAEDETVRIQKLGDESWALIDEAPGQVWPQVRSFLSSAGIAVARIDARAGIMETGWLELENQPAASRFRMRIEQGVQRGTSELHVLQMAQAGDVNTWPATSDSPEQEAEMLRALAQYIANSADTAPVSMVADQAISATGKISLQENASGEAFIALTLPFDRAWASLGKALGESSFDITDRDRSTGLYYTTYLGPDAEDDGGWFDWFGGDDEQPHVGDAFVVSVEKVSESEVNIYLRLQNPARELETRDQQALLTLIKGNID